MSTYKRIKWFLDGTTKSRAPIANKTTRAIVVDVGDTTSKSDDEDKRPSKPRETQRGKIERPSDVNDVAHSVWSVAALCHQPFLHHKQPPMTSPTIGV
jgi:hypothetical protein